MRFIYLLLNLQVPNVLGTLPNTVLAFHTRKKIFYTTHILYYTLMPKHWPVVLWKTH